MREIKSHKILPYTIKASKDILNSKLLKNKVYNIRFEDDFIIFDAYNIKSFNFDYSIVSNNYRKLIKCFLSKYIITMAGLFVFISMIFILRNTITEIKFSDKDTYNDEVYSFVLSKLKKTGMFAFLNESLSDINKEIRKRYYYYKFINVKKSGTTLYINISKENTEITNNKNEKIGSLYARCDAFILGYYAKSGKVLVNPNTSCLEGDELISGTVPIYNDIKNVHPEGYVIGKTVKYYDIDIPILIKENRRTGKVKTKKIFISNEEKIMKDSPFSKYDIETTTIFSFFNIFNYVKVVYYEVKDYTSKYDESYAISYGKSVINNTFNNNKKYDFEKILSLEVVNINRINERYYIKFKTKEIIDISYFKER